MTQKYLDKAPKIASSAFIAENASIVGDVEIGEDSSVWFGAVLRGDVSRIVIGRGSNVQDNAVLHGELDRETIVGDNVVIGHGAIVHAATVGSNTLIGMGAIVLSGAVIGEGCIIGAGAVVKENSVIPAGSLAVGLPAKVVREVRPEQAAELRRQTYYVKLSKDYLEDSQK